MFDSPLSPAQRRRLWIRLAIRLALVLVTVLVLTLVPLLFSLFAPFVCALVAAAVLNPTIRLLQHRLGWGRGIFTLLVLGGVVAGLGGGLFALCYVAAGELTSLAAGWETVLLQVTQVAERLDHLLDRLWQAVPPALSSGVDALYSQLILWLRDFAPLVVERAANWTGQAVGGIPSFLLALLFFLLATYFLTADYPYLRTRLVSHMDDGMRCFSQLVRQTALAAFGGYLRAQFLLSVGVFFILLAGFFLTAQPYGMLIALGLAVLDFIPILGAGTVMVPWAFVALLSGEGGRGWKFSSSGGWSPSFGGWQSQNSWATRRGSPPSPPSVASMWGSSWAECWA